MTEEEMDLDVVSYDASPFEIVINNSIRVAGTLSVSMEKNETPPDPLSDEPYRSIIIKGMLATKYFEQEIEKIEKSKKTTILENTIENLFGDSIINNED